MPGLLLLFSAAAAIAALYLSLVAMMWNGMFRKEKQLLKKSVGLPRVSVIIPVRDEASSIGSCLQDLARQDYPVDQFEVIVVDDQSSDTTPDIAKAFGKDHPGLNMRIVQVSGIESSAGGKKEAIRLAVGMAQGTLMLTTDADTHRQPGWISAMANCYQTNHPKMILGPVTFLPEETFFQKMQTVEFVSLMAATAGLCSAGMPVMCNGANLAYEKQAFLEAGGLEGELGIPSGDDVFLLSHIRRRFGADSIRFLWDERGIVRTEAKRKFSDFWQQRIRWVSKSRGYRDWKILFTAVSTYLFNLMLFAGLVGGIFSRSLLWLALGLILIKSMAEWYPVYRMAIFLKKTNLMVWFLPLQLLNILYVTAVGLLGNLLPYQWKGRKVQLGKIDVKP